MNTPAAGTVNLKTWEAGAVNKPARYYRHRFPIEIVEQCVWLYFRFALSYRNIQQMMAKRGVQLTYETVRE